LRVAEIQAELADIRRSFPGLRAGRRVQSGGGGGTLAPGDDGASGEEPRRRRRGNRKPMTPAQRREVSRRMKAYWASRRTAK
jgi:hypothetical protein